MTAAAPRLIALPGVGTAVGGQILITAGDNPDRLRSEAAFAHLCGVSYPGQQRTDPQGKRRRERGQKYRGRAMPWQHVETAEFWLGL